MLEKTPTVRVPASTPTVGAVLGGLLGTALASHVHDPIAAHCVGGAVSGLLAWLFHFMHSQFGIPE